jgi:hypothetical protein
MYKHPAVRIAGIIRVPEPSLLGNERVKAISIPSEGHQVIEDENLL